MILICTFLSVLIFLSPRKKPVSNSTIELAFPSPMPGKVPTSKVAHYILNEFSCHNPSRRTFEFPEPHRAEFSSVPSSGRPPHCFPPALHKNQPWHDHQPGVPTSLPSWSLSSLPPPQPSSPAWVQEIIWGW